MLQNFQGFCEIPVYEMNLVNLRIVRNTFSEINKDKQIRGLCVQLLFLIPISRISHDVVGRKAGRRCAGQSEPLPAGVPTGRSSLPLGPVLPEGGRHTRGRHG